MEVRCSSCATEYEFDDALVSARGTSVKCTNCGHQFRVHASNAGGSALEKWVVRDSRGKETVFTSLRDLQQAIVRGQLDPKHEMAHGNQAFRPLQDIYELQTFFDVARQRALQQRQPPRTLLGVGRDARPVRASAPPPRRRPTEASPVEERVTPVAHVAGLPLGATREEASSPVNGLGGAEAGFTAPAHPQRTDATPPPAPAGMGRHAAERVSQNPLEPPVIAAEAPVPWQHLQGLREEPELAPSRGAGSKWIVAVVLVGGLALVGGTVGRDYLLGFIHREPPKPLVDARVPALVEQARAALARGDFDTAHAELAKASVLAETEPSVSIAQARLDVARAEPLWLRLRIGAALEATAAEKAAAAEKVKPAPSRRRKGDAEAAAEAEAVAREALEKQQLERSFQDRLASAKKSVSSANFRAPVAIETVRSRIDSLRLEGQLKEARALVAPLSGNDPENAFSLGALDLAEGTAGYPAAIERLRAASRAEEGLGKARALLIYALAQSGDAAGAGAELDKLVTIAPQHSALPALRALVELAQSKVAPAAAPVAARSAPSSPSSSSPSPSPASAPKPAAAPTPPAQDPDFLLTLAASQHREGDLNGAERTYQKVLARRPNSIPALSGLGDIARQRHDGAAAAGYYDQILKQDRNHLSTLMSRGDLYWTSGNRILAVALYRRALGQVGPADPLGQRALTRIEQFDKENGGGSSDGAPGSGTSGTSAPGTAPAEGERAPRAQAEPGVPPRAPPQRLPPIGAPRQASPAPGSGSSNDVPGTAPETP